MNLKFNLGRMMLSKYHIFYNTNGYDAKLETIRLELLDNYTSQNLPGWPGMGVKRVERFLRDVKKL